MNHYYYRTCFGKVTIERPAPLPDPFRRGLLVGFLCAAIPAALGFLLCLTFP